MAELGLGIAGLVGTVEVCVKLGKYLVQASKDYGQSDVKLNELSVRLEVCWSRISSQLEVTREFESQIGEEQRRIQLRVLHVLQSKLDAATMVVSKSEKYAGSKAVKKLHFLSLRDSLEETVTDLESWQKRFEPTWFQLVKVAPPAIDGVLKNISHFQTPVEAEPTHEALRFRRAFNDGQPVLIAEKALENLEKTAIPYCEAQAASEADGGKLHIIDTVSTETVKLKDARELAYRLRDSNPLSFGILRCKGLVRLSQSSSLGFVFRVPDGYKRVRSLRELLLSGQPPESLTVRLKTARQLVAAIYYVHLYEFVHKNISPETILNLETADGEDKNTIVALVGFQAMRHADGKTNTSNKDRKDSLYQHSSRQEGNSVDFIMQHDIYSLGVCLLEIGLWASLVIYEPDGTVRVSNIAGIDPHKDSPDSIQQKLVSLSRGLLRMKMGDVYSKLVETCLTCLDQGNADFGDPREFEDIDGVEVGARYVKKIMETMSTIWF